MIPVYRGATGFSAARRRRKRFPGAHNASVRIDVSPPERQDQPRCGSPAFDAAFRAFVAAMLPDNPLVPIPRDDEIYSRKVGFAT